MKRATVHTGAETNWGRKLVKGGNYSRKYGILELFLYTKRYYSSTTIYQVLSKAIVTDIIWSLKNTIYVSQKRFLLKHLLKQAAVQIPNCLTYRHGLRTPREEIAFTTAWPKIQSHSQILRYGRGIFCLSHRPNFSDSFNLCLHWVSVVRAYRQCVQKSKSNKKQ